LLILSVLFTVLSVSFTNISISGNDPVHILHQMYDSIKNIKTLRMNISAVERLGYTFSSAKSEIKLNMHPRKLYFVNKVKRLEILHKEGEHNNKALIKSGNVPNLYLDTHGHMMRKNQHYTINELGFGFIGKSIALTLAKDKDGLKNFHYKGKTNHHGYHCHIIQYENTNYKYDEYVVGSNETANSIASKLIVNEYLIRYNNDLLNDFGYLKKGTRLLVPNLYCQKAILFIDEKLMLPVFVSLYDNMGLFESYDFTNIIINNPLKEEDFNKDNKEYRFN
jgi:hypothetical protein